MSSHHWNYMLNGLGLIGPELQNMFGITGDVQDLACRIFDSMKKRDRKAAQGNEAAGLFTGNGPEAINLDFGRRNWRREV